MSENEPSNLSAYGPDITRLYGRLTRAIEKRRSVQLTAFEVNLLCATGAYEAVMSAMVKEQKRIAMERLGILPPPSDSAGDDGG